MAVTETIQELLQGIDDAQYGRDMRQFIHKGIQKCYEEGSAGETDLTARESIEKILEIFGDVETTSTASKAYAVGDSVIYDGRLYKVIAAIAQGDTFTEGTNIEETTATSNVGDIYELPFSKPLNYNGNSKLFIIPSIKIMIIHINHPMGTSSNTYAALNLPIPVGLSDVFHVGEVAAPVFLEAADTSHTVTMSGVARLSALKSAPDQNTLGIINNATITENMIARGTLITPYWRLNSAHPFSEATLVDLDI